MSAVAASRGLHRAIAQWQGTLVRDALAEGASWEEIGEALGTTRQAAWARFRTALAAEGGTSGVERKDDVHRRVAELREAGQARLREMAAQWREEQKRLREQVQESKHLLDEAKGRHAQERQAAREDLRRSVASVKGTAS